MGLQKLVGRGTERGGSGKGGGGGGGGSAKGGRRVCDAKGRMSDSEGSVEGTKKNGGASKGDVSMSAAQWASFCHPATETHQHHVYDKSEKVPHAIEGTLAAVAASVIYSASGMSRWGIAEATLGLYKVHCRHDREGVIDTIDGTLVTSVSEMQEMAHWIKWAKAAYKEKMQSCAKELQIEESCIVKLLATSAVGKPAFFIGLNHPKKAVVLSIRGTFSATDVLTDLKPHSERFGDGYAHSGMLGSARWIRDCVADVLKDLMSKNGYRLVLTGHSLGAGTAALLTMLLRETNEKGLTVLGAKPNLVTCWGFCCPPCVDKKLAEEMFFVRCVVHQDDIVPRISPAALEDLRTEILQTDWTQALEDGSKKKMIVDLAQNSVSFIGLIEPALNYEKGELVKQVKEQGFSAFKGLADSLALGWAKVAEGNYGPGAKQAASFLTDGALAAHTQLSAKGKKMVDNMNDAIMHQMQLIEHDSRPGAAVTASSMAANARATNVREGRDVLEQNRLFVPGILYHVIRRPLQPEEKLPEELPVGVGTSKGAEKETRYKHIVIRGYNPSSRFQRIVLSTSFVADVVVWKIQLQVP
ncbi:unnamed protein product [Calypogeia fissa]